jgi:hypothetical protein
MQVSKFISYSMALVALSVSAEVFAWGQNGHRVTGAIAEKYLNAKAKAAVQKLLPLEDLAEAATYADEMRSNPVEFWQKEANSYHFVTVPKGQSYGDVETPAQGDAVTALTKFSATLKDPKASLEDKQLALRFIVHIIGDLHQPLHCGNGTDRGGNDVKLSFMRKDSNLHRVWDSEMIDSRELSYTEWTQRLVRKISKEQAKVWAVADPQVWIAESIQIRDGIYPDNNELSWDYLYTNVPIAQQRMQMAGVRIAAYLNKVFTK